MASKSNQKEARLALATAEVQTATAWIHRCQGEKKNNSGTLMGCTSVVKSKTLDLRAASPITRPEETLLDNNWQVLFAKTSWLLLVYRCICLDATLGNRARPLSNKFCGRPMACPHTLTPLRSFEQPQLAQDFRQYHAGILQKRRLQAQGSFFRFFFTRILTFSQLRRLLIILDRRRKLNPPFPTRMELCTKRCQGAPM